MPKILITGAGGFIGGHIAKHFVQLGWNVHGLDRQGVGNFLPQAVSWHAYDLHGDGLGELLVNESPDVIVHAAGTASVWQSVVDPVSDFRNSVLLWIKVLDAVRKARIACRIIFLSSAAVYGNPKVLPVRETDIINPVSPYGYHKAMCEQISEYYARIYDLQVCNLRIFSAYGIGLKKQVIWDICQKAYKESCVRLLGTGEESRDFIHVGDISRVVELVVGNMHPDVKEYNVANGISIKIRDVAKLVLKTLDVQKEIIFDGVCRPGDPLYWLADVSRLTHMGFSYQVSFDDGIAEYVNWIKRMETGDENC